MRLKLLGLALFLLLGAGLFIYWANDAAPPMPEALAALQSDSVVTVETTPWLMFRPIARQPDTGLIIYPGGRVDYRAYAPTARAIATQGYLVVIPPMPLNLALFNGDAAAAVMRAYPAITRWAVAGHSLGGVAAASFARAHPATIRGLVLWASYPADGDSLAVANLPVLSIAASRDGLNSLADFQRTKTLLPPTTHYVVIEGGNHAQFGYYGPQSGDLTATISRAEQQAQIVSATCQFMSAL